MFKFFRKKTGEEPEETITISAHRVHDTQRAILVEYQELNAWLPHSKIEIVELGDDDIEISLSTRLYKRKFGRR